MKAENELTVVRTATGWRIQGPGGEGANRFLDRLQLRVLAEGSLQTYAYDLLAVLRWLTRSGRTPEALRLDDLYEFLRDHRPRLKPVTLNRLLRLLDRWRRMDQPERGESIIGRRWPRSARLLPSVKEPRLVKRPLTDRQVLRLLHALRTHRDRALVGLLWATGLRIGEALGLRLEDVDWEHSALRVHGKGNRERTLPLVDPVGALLGRYLDLERPCQAEPYLFVVLKGPHRGQRLSYAGARRLFRYYRQGLRLPEAHPHRFRHTFAANMVRQGLSMPMLMRLLGHTWISTTLKYIHFDDRDLRQHYEKAIARLAASRDTTAGDGNPLL